MAKLTTERRIERLEEAVVELARRSASMTGRLGLHEFPAVAELVDEELERHRAACAELGLDPNVNTRADVRRARERQ